MKFLKFVALGGMLLGSVLTQGCFRHGVYRTPRMIVETVRTHRCVGKKRIYPCRYRYGHLHVEVVRCRRGYRTFTRRRRRVVRDRRCRNHAFIRTRRRRSRELIP